MKRFLQLAQRKLGITKNEGIVILILSGSMLGGTVGKFLFSQPATHEVVSADRIIQLLDSIAAMDTHHELDFTSDSIPNDNPNRVGADSKYSSSNEKYSSSTESRGQSPNSGPKSKSVVMRVNINNASASQLERIPGIGPSTARKIIEMRRNRKFQHTDDLLDVKGIGPKKLEKMRPYINAP
ncbi:MAG: helix-hairpin-helix domain-containing protein [Ignavibacteria bacterium]|nr:helix-hairpin-helix domain-containing protein [Ignavibacteria bacterium]